MSLGRRLAGATALALVSLACVAVLYGRALDYELAWMDEREIGQGEIVLGAGEPWSAAFTRPLHRSAAGDANANPYYRPLQILAVTAIHRAAGPAPRAYRALALAAAVATGVAFGLLAWGLFGRLEPAVLAAALALAHPAGLESWVWISGLGDALSAAFAIAAVALGLAAARRTGGVRLGLAAASVAAFVLALLAKEKGIAVPALLAAALAIAWLGRRGAGADREPLCLRTAAGLVAVQGVLGLAYLFAWRPAVLGSAVLAAPSIGGDRLVHGLSALASWPGSLAYLLAPLRSSTSDVVRVVASPGDPRVWLGLGLAAASVVAALALARRGRPVAALGLAWIWIAFAPTANLFPQIHARADRYLFLSVFGAALLVVDLAWRAGPRARRVAGVAAVAALAALWASRTWARAPDWRSTLVLFERDVAADPAFREGRLHLATALFAARRHAEADAHLALLLAPEVSGARTWGYLPAGAARDLACANDLALGRHAKVIADLEALARREPETAAQPGLQTCRAQALEAQGRFAEALGVQQAVVDGLAGAPPPPAVSLAMARLHARLGQREDARRWLERARRDGPREPAFDWELRQVERLAR